MHVFIDVFMYRSQRRWVCASISSKYLCRWWFGITLELHFIPSLVSSSREQLPTLIKEHKYNNHVQCMCVRVYPLDRLMSEHSLSGRHWSVKWATLISLITSSSHKVLTYLPEDHLCLCQLWKGYLLWTS